MSAIRILHVDDEPDIREVVDMSLGLNAEFEVRGCASGAEAITAAAEWSPFLIMLDVMMPGMDGPTTLAHLRKNPRTCEIPVLFMTARAQAREVEQFVALGAQGVVSKPFDPMTLAALVRSHLHTIRLDTMRKIFVQRAKSDATALASCRPALVQDASAATLGRIRTLAHGLAGAAGLFGFDRISSDAAALEEAVVAARARQGGAASVVDALDRLTAGMQGEWSTQRAHCASANAGIKHHQ